jgi:excisionase family DNA binding protein
MPEEPTGPAPAGYTPSELARILRVNADRVRAWIRSGEMPALNLASKRCVRPRFVVLPHHLAAFERKRAAALPPRPPRRERKSAIDYYPD